MDSGSLVQSCIEAQQLLRHRMKALAVQRCWAQPLQRRQMRRAGVALVLRQSVAGIRAVQLNQQAVAIDLGQNGGSGN